MGDADLTDMRLFIPYQVTTANLLIICHIDQQDTTY